MNGRYPDTKYSDGTSQKQSVSSVAEQLETQAAMLDKIHNTCEAILSKIQGNGPVEVAMEKTCELEFCILTSISSNILASRKILEGLELINSLL